jgi:hypothetical protein
MDRFQDGRGGPPFWGVGGGGGGGGVGQARAAQAAAGSALHGDPWPARAHSGLSFVTRPHTRTRREIPVKNGPSHRLENARPTECTSL